MAGGQRNKMPKAGRGKGKVPMNRGSRSDMRRSGQDQGRTATQESAVRSNSAGSLSRAPSVQSSNR